MLGSRLALFPFPFFVPGVTESSGCLDFEESNKNSLWLGAMPGWQSSTLLEYKSVLRRDFFFHLLVKLALLMLSRFTSQLMTGEINYPWGKGTLEMVNSTKLLSKVKLLSLELKKAIKPDWCACGLFSVPELTHGIRSRISQILKILITEYLGFSSHYVQVLYQSRLSTDTAPWMGSATPYTHLMLSFSCSGTGT